MLVAYICLYRSTLRSPSVQETLDQVPMAPSTEEEAERLYMASFIKFRRGSGYIHRIPPTRILMFPEIFEVAWGWERILPKDFCSMPLYLDYLKEYHSKNRMACVTAADVTSKPEHSPHEVRPVDDVTQCHRNGKDDLIAAARSCLDMEKQFMSKWNNQPVHNVKLLSERIQERACYLIHMEREFSEPAAASLLCITNEATLALELLRYGAKSTDKEFILCNYIRQCALSLMYIEGPHSDASTAAMVGVAKEAKKIREWMVANKELYLFGSYALYHEMGLCDLVRTSTFGVMKHILSNYTGNSEPFAVMNFREIMTDSKVQKTMSGTSDKSLSQKQLIGQKNILELNDDDGASDALMINNQTDYARERTNDLANGRRECDKSEDKRAQHLKTIPDIQGHLPEKIYQVEKVALGKQSAEQANILTPACGRCVTKQPALLDERTILVYIAHAVSTSDGSRIKKTDLPNMLRKLLTPLHWRDYKKRYGKLDDFVARHPKLFVIKGEFIHLHKRAKHISAGFAASSAPCSS